MSFIPPIPKKKKDFHYILPMRLVMVKHNCMFCDKNCKDGIYSIYVNRPNFIGYQFCQDCKNDANKCVKKYCKESKVILLSLLFDDYESVRDKSFNIPRSNGDIEKWHIECETVIFNHDELKWCIYFRSKDFKYFKGVYLEKILELNKDSPEILKISDYIKETF